MDIEHKKAVLGARLTAIDRVRSKIDPDVLNFEHLAQYTCGDDNLEQSLLVLFKEQAILQFDTIVSSNSQDNWKIAVHTLKGSARSIGAGQVAELTTELEQAGFGYDNQRKKALTEQLRQAVALCIVMIDGLAS